MFGSSCFKRSEGRGHPGPPPGTKPRARRTASLSGDSRRGNCSHSAACFPRPQRPLVPAHGHTQDGVAGRRERTGLQPTTQGQGPLHIWGPLQETLPEGPILPACPPRASSAGLGLQPGCSEAGLLEQHAVYRERRESLQLRGWALLRLGLKASRPALEMQ